MEYVGFDGETFKSFKKIDDNRPLHMLNLVQLKKKLSIQMVTFDWF